MLGFGWVKIHFWRCIIGKYTSFIRFLIRFLEKEKNIANLGKSLGSYAAAKVLVAVWHVHAAARPRGGFGEPQIRRGEAGVFFCYVFSLVRGLVYWTNEDPISL